MFPEAKACALISDTSGHKLHIGQVFMSVWVKESFSVICWVIKDTIHFNVKVSTFVSNVNRNPMAVHRINDSSCGNLGFQQTYSMIFYNQAFLHCLKQLTLLGSSEAAHLQCLLYLEESFCVIPRILKDCIHFFIKEATLKSNVYRDSVTVYGVNNSTSGNLGFQLMNPFPPFVITVIRNIACRNGSCSLKHSRAQIFGIATDIPQFLSSACIKSTLPDCFIKWYSARDIRVPARYWSKADWSMSPLEIDSSMSYCHPDLLSVIIDLTTPSDEEVCEHRISQLALEPGLEKVAISWMEGSSETSASPLHGTPSVTDKLEETFNRSQIQGFFDDCLLSFELRVGRLLKLIDLLSDGMLVLCCLVLENFPLAEPEGFIGLLSPYFQLLLRLLPSFISFSLLLFQILCLLLELNDHDMLLLLCIEFLLALLSNLFAELLRLILHCLANFELDPNDLNFFFDPGAAQQGFLDLLRLSLDFLL
ncbi:hypothetical protein DNTS_022642 [Danionella cerebrum]|uniref:Uncharacterized protein n=1 Tax=Danionella cerebrum TaxID=2873325 RepID=A0A553QEA4_9TELE|nr:hypothetical protein DNTS_022642 [Danionella translucida]